ncbi:hypothetical protein B296_00025012, partial [Ensete ventricosum]
MHCFDDLWCRLGSLWTTSCINFGQVQRVGEGSASGLKWDLEVNSEKSWRGFSFVLALCCNCIRVSCSFSCVAIEIKVVAWFPSLSTFQIST